MPATRRPTPLPLADGGFEADIAPSGEEALSRFRNGGSGCHALLTNIGIGTEWVLARRIREIEPDFPVIYTTGGHSEEWNSQGVPNSIVIEKPLRRRNWSRRSRSSSTRARRPSEGSGNDLRRHSEQRYDREDNGEARHGHAPA
ncbi:hypothetical protein [Bradyrhizobium sp. WSM1253]|uniref:hypothetical protein n=1 Tax=Bradyrhizobium sp. WSM1253 TaxID=319003 RepID=UPI00025D0EE3|nr:hypothetical protein [Bradyrhizobium sp. WSM1253]EIG63702.1 hypothetical protein Bra1253DRAFT_00216 [Bradyrhizobium sp. WSM1253]